MQAARRRLSWNVPSTIKVVFSGNSIVAGGDSNFPGGIPTYLSSLAPFSTQTLVNLGHGGRDTDWLIANAADVDAAYDSSKTCILFVQEGTNQNTTGDSPASNAAKMRAYIAARKAANPWKRVVLATAPPCYLGDQATQAATDEWNLRLWNYNEELKRTWPDFVDALVNTRQDNGPFSQLRYPDYLRATFFSNTVIGDISNNASLVVEPSGGATPYQRIHPTGSAQALLAKMWSAALLGLRA